MMQEWTAQNVEFMRDASQYHPEYYELLAQMVSQKLDDSARVCDAGCGEGFLSTAIAPFCGQVTAIDRMNQPLEVLRENIRKNKIGNITVLNGEIQQLPPPLPYTGMVFCYFGGTPEVLHIAKQQCCGTLIIITRNYTTHRFALDRSQAARDNVPSCRSELDKLGIAYDAQFCEPEFGQPFRSLCDAVRFFESYSPDKTRRIAAEEIENRLICTDNAEFPLYLPMRKKMGIFTVKVSDIPADYGVK